MTPGMCVGSRWVGPVRLVSRSVRSRFMELIHSELDIGSGPVGASLRFLLMRATCI